MCMLTIGGLALMAKGDYGRLTPDITQESVQDYSSKNSVTPLTSQSNHSQIARLFGQVMGKAHSPVQKELPETRLDLILKGTFTHEDSNKASALISEVNKDTNRYFIGDKIPGAAKLVAVNKGEVTLRRNGQDELLKLPFFQVDEHLAKKGQRRTSHNGSSQTASNSNVSNPSGTNQNPGPQQQLKDRLARLRNNSPKQ